MQRSSTIPPGPETIDRVLRNVVGEASGIPGDPADRVSIAVAEPTGPLAVRPDAAKSEAIAGAIDELVGEIGAMLHAASRPALRRDGFRRHGLTEAVVRLAERLRVPVVTDLLGKAAFPESHPQFAGIYLGALGEPGARSLLDESDCVLGIGVVATDLGTGFWTQRIHPSARVMVDADSVQVRYHRYDGVPIIDVVTAMVERLPAGDRPMPHPEYPAPPRRRRECLRYGDRDVPGSCGWPRSSTCFAGWTSRDTVS